MLVDRVVHLARFGMLYRLPIVLSTVNVSTGRNQPTIAPLQDVLPEIAALDRTTINAWEDAAEIIRPDRQLRTSSGTSCAHSQPGLRPQAAMLSASTKLNEGSAMAGRGWAGSAATRDT